MYLEGSNKYLQDKYLGKYLAGEGQGGGGGVKH